MRLLLSLLTCQFLAAAALAVVRFCQTSPAVNPWLFGALVGGGGIALGVTLFVLRQPWTLDRFARRMVELLVFLYLGMTLVAFAQHLAGQAGPKYSILRTIVAALSFQGMVLVFAWRFVREHQTSWNEGFGFAENRQRAVLFGLSVGGLFLPVSLILQMASAELLTRLNFKPEMQPAIQALSDTASWVDSVVIGIAAIGLAPVAEEILFRGILYPGIKQAGFPRAALWISSLLFAAVHRNLPTFLPLLLLAITLTVLYEKTNNLLACISAHASFNALNFAMFYLFESKFGPPA